MLPEPCPECRLLAAADLDERDAGRCQQPEQVRRHRPVGVEPVLPAVERQARLVHGDLGLERGEVGRGDVGRVGEDQVEGGLQALAPAGPQETGAIGKAQPRGVGRRYRQRLVGEVGAGAGGVREQGEDRRGGGSRCRCRGRGRASRAARSGRRRQAASTRVSVSGRGTRTPGLISSS